MNPARSTLTVTGYPTRRRPSCASVTVTAYDEFGNVATGYAGTVAASRQRPIANLPVNYTFTAANAGTHTFSATFITPGTQSITATDTVTGTITDTKATSR